MGLVFGCYLHLIASPAPFGPIFGFLHFLPSFLFLFCSVILLFYSTFLGYFNEIISSEPSSFLAISDPPQPGSNV